MPNKSRGVCGTAGEKIRITTLENGLITAFSGVVYVLWFKFKTGFLVCFKGIIDLITIKK